MAMASLTAVVVLASCAPALGARERATPPRHPSRATVLQVQRLFHELGYPLGSERAGVLGIRTRGALSYFQRKYALSVTGYPDPRTITLMRTVAASLRGQPSARAPQPRDLVERVLGARVPILTIAAALVALICALALSVRADSAQDSAAAEDSVAVASGEG